MMTVMIVQKILRICVMLTSALLILLLVSIIAIQLFLGTETAGRLIQDRINAAIPGHISWEDQSLSVFKGTTGRGIGNPNGILPSITSST